MAPKIADYLVIRLLETRAANDREAEQGVTSLLLDMLTAFPQASLEDFSQGIAMARVLVQWQENPLNERRLKTLAEAIRALFKR